MQLIKACIQWYTMRRVGATTAIAWLLLSPKLPPPAVFPMLPAYPFQCICSDYVHYKEINYLVIVDRYSNWPIVERAHEGAACFGISLCRVFDTYGIGDKLSSDGGPQFTSKASRNFLNDWDVNHRFSPVAFPHSNCHVKIGIKLWKGLSLTIPDLYWGTEHALTQYREPNTPNKDTKLSSVMCVFDRPIRDFISIIPSKYKPHDTWAGTLPAQEEALRNRRTRTVEQWSEHTEGLPALKVGDSVRIQH